MDVASFGVKSTFDLDSIKTPTEQLTVKHCRNMKECVNQKQSPDPGLKQVWKPLATTMSPKTTPARTFQSKDMLESIQSFNKTEETKT